MTTVLIWAYFFVAWMVAILTFRVISWSVLTTTNKILMPIFAVVLGLLWPAVVVYLLYVNWHILSTMDLEEIKEKLKEVLK